MRLMKQPYITYATAATMGQLELEFGVNPSKFLHITVRDLLSPEVFNILTELFIVPW